MAQPRARGSFSSHQAASQAPAPATSSTCSSVIASVTSVVNATGLKAGPSPGPGPGPNPGPEAGPVMAGSPGGRRVGPDRSALGHGGPSSGVEGGRAAREALVEEGGS